MSKNKTSSFFLAMALLAILSVFAVVSLPAENDRDGGENRMAALVSKVTVFWQWLNLLPSRDTSERLLEAGIAAKEAGEEAWESAPDIEEMNGVKRFYLKSEENSLDQNSLKLVKDDGGWDLEVTGHDGKVRVIKLFHR